ncbi:hypothetical protein AVEN_239873-1 [Araneus ventricosus]|uniref:Uncharacterized protein n=1 Tax=Araneus ventricosus TaxID=182803 RepID=A0A4Y2T6I1_ARAVE|nr:hypothetical protein AVEN_239873-1 [Araneus ventricosus]
MGKCYSCFRAKFTPSSQDGKTGGLPLVPTRKPSKPDVPGELPRPPSVDSNRFTVKVNRVHVLPILD